MQMYWNFTTTLNSFVWYPNLTTVAPNYTFVVPYVNSTSMPGPWSMNVCALTHFVGCFDARILV